MDRHVLVTGATGFAGSHVMDALLERGYRVRVLIRPTSNLRWIPADRVETVVADVRDEASMGSLVEGVSWVFHFGGITRSRSRQEMFRVNCEGTLDLARAFEAASPPGGMFLFCSSLAATGPAEAADRPRREDDPPRPISAYGESKLAAERLLEQNLGSGVRLVVVRPPAIYGPRDEAIVPFFRWVKWGWIPLPSPRESRVSLIHGRDLAEGCVALAEGGAAGTFHLADDSHYRWEEIGRLAGEALGRRTRGFRIPVGVVHLAGVGGDLAARLGGAVPVINRDKVRDIRQPFWITAVTKARQSGVRQRIELRQGIRETARWYAEEGWI